MTESNQRPPSIGIDLGTTTSCVAVYRNYKIETIPNEAGHGTTASYVSFTPSERIVGDRARDEASLNPLNTIFDAKRLLGRYMKEDDVKTDIKSLPYNVVNCGNGVPAIKVLYKGESRMFDAEEISAMILAEMKRVAEQFLDTEVNSAVITVPAYFSDTQRMLTRNAGAMAGLDVLRIVNEPTAAALLYGLNLSDETSSEMEKTVMVFDLGGGTLDVSLVSIRGGLYEVIATAGNTHLGGQDFNHRLLHHFLIDIQRKFKKDLSADPKAISKLRAAAEDAKKVLSEVEKTTINVSLEWENIEYKSSLSRQDFEDLCIDQFQLCMSPVVRVMGDAELEKDAVSEIILVGGSTRIPKIRHLLREWFDGKELYTELNPNEAVAHGAAVQAAILSGDQLKKTDDLLLLDVTPLSIGIQESDGKMSTVIKRNSIIPTRGVQQFSTTRRDQKHAKFHIFEGERTLATKNLTIGTVDLYGLEKAKVGVPKIDVIFDIDADGILEVVAKDQKTGSSATIPQLEKKKSSEDRRW